MADAAEGARTKVVVRRLPATLTEAQFRAEVGEEWLAAADWFSYWGGKPRCARAQRARGRRAAGGRRLRLAALWPPPLIDPHSTLTASSSELPPLSLRPRLQRARARPLARVPQLPRRRRRPAL
jgi:hypothetical protein